jgi:CysZ protein
MHYLFEGLRLIRQPGLRAYVIIPLIINVLVFVGLFGYGLSLVDSWLTSVIADLPEWLGFLYWLVWILVVITAVLVWFFCFTIVANIIASPFNALLSVKVEERLTGEVQPAGSFNSFLTLLPRTLAREFSKLMYYLPRLIGLALVTIIPGVNFIAPFLWLLFGAWMMTVQYTDFGADNNNVRFGELRERLSEERMASLSFGVIVYLMIAVPLLNLVVMPAAVAGGTVFWVERLKE